MRFRSAEVCDKDDFKRGRSKKAMKPSCYYITFFICLFGIAPVGSVFDTEQAKCYADQEGLINLSHHIFLRNEYYTDNEWYPGRVGDEKAIIVAGGGEGYDGDYLWSTTLELAQTAEEALEYQGYTPQNILQLTAGHPDPQQDATLDNLRYAITQWATERFEPGYYEIEQLLIYMTGHGRDSKFLLNGVSNLYLPAETLRNWMDELQMFHQNIRVIFIYDACHAGSFIQPLKIISDSVERIILASTQAGDAAIFAESGLVSFSYTFWESVVSSGAVYASFRKSEGWMTSLGQIPSIQIPDQYSGENDIYIGIGFSEPMQGEGVPPINIKSIYAKIGNEKRNILSCNENTVTIGAVGVKPVYEADHIQARILYEEDENPDIPATGDAPKINLAPSIDLDFYEKEVDLFTKEGLYHISIHAQSPGCKHANPKGMEIRKTCKCDLNADGTVDLIDAILALKAAAGIHDLSICSNYENHLQKIDVNGDSMIGLFEAIYAIKQAVK